jgi:Xaa-Pro aminopeptidase
VTVFESDGAPGGNEGVKLEEQVLITETGVEILSRRPFDERLLS